MVLLAVVMPLIAIFRTQPVLKSLTYDTPTKIKIYLSNCLSIWLLALLVIVTWIISGRDITQLGFQKYDMGQLSFLGWYIILFAGMYIADTIHSIATEKERDKSRKHLLLNTPFLPATRKEFLYFILLVASTAAICEEIIYRGYFINYFVALIGDSPIGVICSVFIPAVIFALVHVYQGYKVVMKIVVMSLIFGIVFLYSGSLWPLIIMHYCVDFVSSFVAMKLMNSGS
jgi:membrane protease YdiL (CAAX protease family)